MELTIALDLPFQPVEKAALKFRNLAAAQAGHVNMVALRPSFVEVLLSFHMHKVEFIYQPVPFKQVQRPVNGHAVNVRISFAGMAKDLARIQMLLRGLHNAQDCAALMGHAQAARH